MRRTTGVQTHSVRGAVRVPRSGPLRSQ